MPDSSFIPVDSNILPDIKTGTPAVMYGSRVVVAGIGGNYIPNQVSGIPTADGNIHNNNVLQGYIGYNSNGRVVGSIPVIAGGTYTVGSQGYVMPSGVYLGDNVYFYGSGEGGVITSDGDITALTVLSGYIGYNSLGRVQGTVPVISGGTHYVDSTGYTLSSGYYLAGDQLFIGEGTDVTLGVAVDGGVSGILFQQLSFSGRSASDHGSAIDVASSFRTWNTGHPAPEPETSDGNITPDKVLYGYIGYNSSGRVQGTIPSISGSSYSVGYDGLTISSGYYLQGAQTITLSSGYYNIQNGNIQSNTVLSGYIGYNSSGLIEGSIPLQQAGTSTLTISGPSSYIISGGVYLAGAQTINIRPAGNITADKVLAGYSGLNSSGIVSGAIPSLYASSRNIGIGSYTLSAGQYLSGAQTFVASLPSDGNITPARVLSGYIGYNSSGQVTGSIPSLAGSTYTVGSQGITLSAGQYMAGDQIISRYLQGDIDSNTVLSGYSGLNQSGLISGTIPSIAGSTYTVGSQGFTLSAGQYLAGDQVFVGSGGLPTSDGNITSDTVLSGYIGYNSTGRIVGGITTIPASSYVVGSEGLVLVSGIYLSGAQQINISSGYYHTSDATITSDKIIEGYSGYGTGGLIAGSIPNLPATSYTVTEAGFTLSAGQYLAGDQLFIGSGSGIVTSDGNITSDTVLSGYIGYNSEGRISGAMLSLPTFTSSVLLAGPSNFIVPSGFYLQGSQTIAVSIPGNITSNTVLSGYSGMNSQGVVSGSIPSLPATSYTVTQAGLVLSSGYYLAGDQLFIGSGSGIVTSDGNITADTVLSGYIGYNSTGRVLGSIPSIAGSTYTVTSEGLTLSSGQYLAGDQIISPYMTGNITSNTVLSGYSGMNSQGVVSGVIEQLNASTYYISSSFVLSSGKYLAGDQTFVGSAVTASLQGANGSVTLNSGGKLSYLSLQNGARIDILSGGSADNIALNSGGSLFVRSRGRASNIAVNSFGSAVIDSFGVISTAEVKGPSASIIASLGGIVDAAEISSDGNIHVQLAGTATNTKVQYLGTLQVSNGGTATLTSVYQGTLKVYQGANVQSVYLSGGTILGVSSANIYHISASPQEISTVIINFNNVQDLVIDDPQLQMSNLYNVDISSCYVYSTTISGGTLTCLQGGTIAAAEVGSGSNGSTGFILMSSGLIVNTVVRDGGYLSIADNYRAKASAAATSTTILGGGDCRVISGGTAVSTILQDGASMTIQRSGIADYVSVYTGATLTSMTGAIVTNVVYL